MKRFVDVGDFSDVDAEVVSLSSSFDVFMGTSGERLRRVLVAQYGLDEGCDLAAEALGYAWEHWERVGAMGNPVGFLYRLAQNAARKRRRWSRRPLPIATQVAAPSNTDPELVAALAELRPAHRAAVVLVHAFGWSYGETAEALAVPVSTVRIHVHRGLTALRQRLGDER